MSRKYSQEKKQNVIGFSLLAFSFVALISCISYNSGDPSFNVATDMSAKNIFGLFGSYLSDFLLQYFGGVSYLIILLSSLWGFAIVIRYNIFLIWMRAFLAVLMIIASCTFIEIFMSYKDYYYEFMPGGYVGNAMFSKYIPKGLFLKYLSSLGLAFLIFVCGYFCLIFDKEKSKGLFHSIKKSLSLPLILFYPFQKTLRFFKNVTKFLVVSAKNDPIIKVIFQAAWQSIKYVFSKRTRQSLQTKVEIYETNDKLVTNAQHNVVDDESNIPNFIPKEKVQTIITNQSFTSEASLDVNYSPPKNELLGVPKAKNAEKIDKPYASKVLTQTMLDFGVVGNVVDISVGPVVSLFEFKPKAGTKSSRIIGLADDIARTMQKTSARISVMQGKDAMAVEIPNKIRSTIYLREVFESNEFKHSTAELPMALGHDIAGVPVIADLAKMPHLLIAGTTGSGKSVGINTMILSLLYKLSPSECKMIMIDPKMLELSVYDGIPHLMTPVITDPKNAIMALKWVVAEMENRYRTMSSLGVRNIINYNSRVEIAIKNGTKLTKKIDLGYNKDLGKMETETIEFETKKMPYIVVIVDEMADLMITAGKEVEAQIQRLAQMARASGIHIIMATQRPSVDIITGVIKANFPSRISFQVTSKIDSRTILGEMGAEQLLGQGDMLFMQGGSKTTRVHGPFVSDQEVQDIVSYLKENNVTNYIDVLDSKNATSSIGNMSFNMYDDFSLDGGNSGAGIGDDEKLYRAAVNVVIQDKRSSISYVQRKLRVGYNKAASLIERMEDEGILSSPDSMGKRMIMQTGGGDE